MTLNTFIKSLLGVLLAIILVAGGYFVLAKTNLLGWEIRFSADSYQAVFLSNNQVYFGKVTDLNKDYVRLTDIYYLIIKRPLQQQTPAEGEQPSPPEYTLIKLGNELHGPKDEMVINRKHVLFVEDLKSDSKVVTAILENRSAVE